MEPENNKRGREGQEAKDSFQKTAKKQHLNIEIGSINIEVSSYDHDDNNQICESSDNYLALGVFDFPWLKEGVISKWEDWCFQDSFEFSLHESYTTAALAHEFSDQYLSETSETIVESTDIPSDLHYLPSNRTENPNRSFISKLGMMDQNKSSYNCFVFPKRKPLLF
ncbi:hypothetical protein MANES_09G072700v8 [Manihot esculenta]|uniref:Uncharacterized protein n=1 Tax=Manihot esculenta TaxID=3983 RepID=A0ACB7H690_MANES|nr:hypothetical protein MANES_09G072700v8 [Manihot esculenta]